jgi:putative hemolysin
MTVKAADTSAIIVRTAQNRSEVEAAQHLRYKVFYEEYKATPTREMEREKRDIDEFDDFADHLVVIDQSVGSGKDGIVGTYRLLRKEVADKHGQFYTSSEYDITPILNYKDNQLELGRSCVLAPYRTRPVMQLLWKGIADYVTRYDISLMFGCASFHETDINKISMPLAYLYHFHLAPEGLRPRTLPDKYIDMNLHSAGSINPRKVFSDLPPLMKGYLRLGASVGDGAFIDPVFRTTDVCIVLETQLVTSRYKKHYERTPSGSDPDKQKNETKSTIDKTTG